MPAPSVLPGQRQHAYQGSNSDLSVGLKRSPLQADLGVLGVELLSKHKLAEGRRHLFADTDIKSGLVAQGSCRASRLFSQLFPQGMQLGSVVSVAGSAARLLAVSMFASLQSSGWGCVVGLANHGIAAYSELGLKLSKTLFVNNVHSSGLASSFTRVIAECVSSVKVVLAQFPKGKRVSATEASRIKRHLASNASVLITINGAGRWPEVPDYQVEASTQSFVGIGDGFGRIKEHVLDIDLSVRRNPSLNSSLTQVCV